MLKEDQKDLRERQEGEHQKSTCQICMCAFDEVDDEVPVQDLEADIYDERPAEEIYRDIQRRKVEDMAKQQT